MVVDEHQRAVAAITDVDARLRMIGQEWAVMEHDRFSTDEITTVTRWKQ